MWWIQKDVNTGKNVVAFARSEDHGNTFGKPVEIPESMEADGGNGEGPPRMIVKEDGTMLLVFNRPNPAPENRFAGDVLYTQSTDGGQSWTEPKPIHSDGKRASGQGFPVLANLPNGEVAAVWLDGRNNKPWSEVYFAVTSGKNGFGNDRKIGGAACQCCKNAMLVDESGRLHVAYRSLVDGTRDIMHMVSTDMGETFSEPRKVSKDQWEIEACPHNGPDLATSGDKLQAVWYTNSAEKGMFYAERKPGEGVFANKIKLTSNELAKHIKVAPLVHEQNMVVAVWDEKIKSTNSSGMNARIAYKIIQNGNVVEGDYLTSSNTEACNPSLLSLDNGSALVVWTEKNEGNQFIRYEKIS